MITSANVIVSWLLLVYSSVCFAYDVRFVSSTDQDCSNTLGQIGNTSCLSAHVRYVDKHDDETLIHVLEGLDHNHLVRRVYIDAMAMPVVGNVSVIGSALDRFLIPRPWWTVISEKYKIHHEHADRQTTHAFLMRFNPRHEKQLRLIAAIQFPPLSICTNTPLILGNMLDKGWGSQLTLWDGYYHYFTLFNVWDSVRNEKEEAMIYASKHQCPHLVNKRECAFLPVTNCSVPKCFTTVSGVTVAKKCWNNRDFAIYSNASADAELKLNYQDTNQPHNPYQEAILHSNDELKPSIYRTFPATIFVDAVGKQINSNQFSGFLATYSMLLRPNALYRDMVMDEVHEYQRVNSFPLGLPCITFQIRRGDRVPKGVGDVAAYCNQFKQFLNGTCLKNNQPSNECGPADDHGCFAYKAYGSLTLMDYLQRAVQLTNSTTAFIMTDDDGDWLDQQIKGLSEPWNQWNFNILPSRYDNHSPKKNEVAQKQFDAIPNRETLSGVEFLTSVTLARQCEAFIGHFSSGFALAMYRLMCIQHGHKTGQCPNACDIGNIYSDEGTTVFSRTY